jgi:hypothetical protein
MGFLQNKFQAKPAELEQINYGDALRQQMAGGLEASRGLVDTGAAEAVGGEQAALSEQLAGAAAGAGPSVAEEALKRATQQNVKQAASQISAVKGLNPGLAARMVLQGAAQAQQESAGQGAELRAKEVMGARQQLAEQLQARRQQALGTQQLRMQAGLGQLTGVGGLLATQSQQKQVGEQEAQRVQAQIEEANANRLGQILGSVLGAGAGVGAAAIGKKAQGGMIPGKAKVPGDSEKNDTVPILASPGEIIIPRSAAGSPESAKFFVDAIMKQRGDQYGEPQGYARVLAAYRKMKSGFDEMEKMAYGGRVC